MGGVGGVSSPRSWTPPSQDLGSVKDQGRDSTSFVGQKLCLWRGPGVLFGPKWELRCPGSYLPPGGAQAPSLAGPELPVSIQPLVPSPGKAAPSCLLSSGSISPQCPALLPALHGGVVGCMHVSDEFSTREEISRPRLLPVSLGYLRRAQRASRPTPRA